MVDDKTYTWPHLVRLEFLVTIFVMVILIVWSIVIDAPLEEPANPTRTPNPSKAPWYFLGLQEMLVYFDPWYAGVVLPSFIIVGLMMIPFIDINQKGNGYYTFKERKYEILTFLFGFHVLWVVMIIIGTFFRGPGWNLFWPWQAWDPHKVVALTNIDLHEFFGIRSIAGQTIFGMAVLAAYFIVGFLVPTGMIKKRAPKFYEQMGPVRWGTLMLLALSMLGLPIKMILRLGFNVKYVAKTPWFNV